MSCDGSSRAVVDRSLDRKRRRKQNNHNGYNKDEGRRKSRKFAPLEYGRSALPLLPAAVLLFITLATAPLPPSWGYVSTSVRPLGSRGTGSSEAGRTRQSLGQLFVISRRPKNPPPSSSSLAPDNDEARNATAGSAAVNGDNEGWNASGSFGSLLMQLQKKEEAMINQNTHKTDEELVDAVDLDVRAMPKQEREEGEVDVAVQDAAAAASTRFKPTKKSRIAGKFGGRPPPQPEQPPEEKEIVPIDTMDYETAKELDDAVTTGTGSLDDLRIGMKVLPLDSLYLEPDSAAAAASGLPFSRPEYYRDRVGQDLGHLAVNIASSIESIDQWRLFCQESGGLYPLLTAIRQGAESVSQSRNPLASSGVTMREANNTAWLGWDGDRKLEASFLAACNAFRALRDVCALSPQVAAVVTDGIIRANQAWGGKLLQDFGIFLKYPHEFEEEEDGSPKRLRRKRLRLRWSRRRRDARLRCKLYVNQLLLDMTFSSDDAVAAIRETPGLSDAIVSCSSFARKEQTRRWLRYPGELARYFWLRVTRRNRKKKDLRRPFLEAATVANDLNGQVQKTSNMALAAIGYNHWVPKIPGQKGLRILCIDGGGSRGMTAVTAVHSLMEHIGDDMQVADCFDIVAGTSTGGIISFLTGLRQETTAQAVERYDLLIKQIFVKSALSTPRMVFTTATYDESRFMDILSNILDDHTMLDSRADPSTPYVFCVTSKMSSTPTHVALFRNYNYGSGEMPDHFTIDPAKAREELDLPLQLEHELIQSGRYQRREVPLAMSPGIKISDGSRHPGSFRVLQRYALRASTAAPTVFKPALMGGEMYCDGMFKESLS